MTEPAALRSRLRAVAARRVRLGPRRVREGIASVAAAIADASGEIVAAVHVHGPAYRFPAAGAEAALGLRSRPPPPGSPGGFVRPADLPPMAGRAMAPGDVLVHGVSYQKRW